MKLKLFTVRDSRVETFSPPMSMRHVGEAERWCADLVNDGKSIMSKNPEDFALFELGEWDDVSAEFKLLPQPHKIALCSSFRHEAQQAAGSFNR